MLEDFLKRSNLVSDRIANTATQAVGDFSIPFCRLVAKGAFRGYGDSVDGLQPPRKCRQLPQSLH